MIPFDKNALRFPIVSLEATEFLSASKPKKEKQILIAVEGKMSVSLGNSAVLLQSGDWMAIEAGHFFTLSPLGKTGVLLLDLPRTKVSKPFLWNEKIDRGTYVVYDLIEKQSWSAALIEIHDSPRHFHKIEREVFIVLQGALDIEIEGMHHILERGEAIVVVPGKAHRLKAAQKEAVQVLCLSFPAFDPADMYLVGPKE